MVYELWHEIDDLDWNPYSLKRCFKEVGFMTYFGWWEESRELVHNSFEKVLMPMPISMSGFVFKNRELFKFIEITIFI